jgi:hypothetical protein
VAVIRQFVEGHQLVRHHPTEVDCYFQVLPGPSPRLHLSTFGSDQRESEPKSSQSIQLDEDRARELIDILKRSFPGLQH